VVEPKLIKIPFDSFVLSAVVAELQEFVGGKVQSIRQPSEHEVCIGIYAGGREAMLLLNCHPEFARAHFITKRPANQPQPPVFVSTLRSRLDGSRLVGAVQVQGDRVLDLQFESPLGDMRLIAELMGKHSNLILIDGANRVVSAAKWVGRGKSSRPIQPSSKYELPPVITPGDTGRRSPFLAKLLLAAGFDQPPAFAPVLAPGHGAYPMSVASLGLREFSRASISIALEQHFDQAIPQAGADSLRASLLAQLKRIALAKEVALSDLREAEEAGGKAPQWQRAGELVLAYGTGIQEGSSELQAWDYDGVEVTIKLDPEKNFKENANRYFEKAKKAKGRMGMVKEQITRITNDHSAILETIASVQDEVSLQRLKEFQEHAISRRWINLQVVQAAHKEDRPYEGHRVRELSAPGGYTVLYGENAESNDYLTLRVAKPNDLWLHVRGSTSAHVVIVTRNQPEKVQLATILFAAKVAVLNSTSKHSGYVPVDYTLKKYVRRPKGAAKGSVHYTQEKTLHVETE